MSFSHTYLSETGDVILPLLGVVATRCGIQSPYVTPTMAFAFIAFCGISGYRADRKEPIAA
jgi:hypothetical protein